MSGQMKHDEAAEACEFKKSRLKKATGIEYYDAASNSFFYRPTLVDATGPNPIIRKPGRGSKNHKGWEPVTSVQTHQEIEQWKANQEGREIEIKQPWEQACEKSSLKRCYRITDKGHRMVRTESRNTWLEWGQTGSIQKQSGVFKQYDDWRPMEPGDEYEHYNLDGDGYILHGPPKTAE